MLTELGEGGECERWRRLAESLSRQRQSIAYEIGPMRRLVHVVTAEPSTTRDSVVEVLPPADVLMQHDALYLISSILSTREANSKKSEY